VARVAARAKLVRTGDPLDEATKVGAIINPAQFEKIRGYLEAGKKSGATLVLGGDALAAPKGRFIQPTIFDHVRPEMMIAREEIFGPVLSVLRFSSEDEAVQLANEVAYGLSASIWTRDLDRALTLSRRIEAGTVWVNCFMDGFPELPFGGYKQSGLGRELGKHAVEDYTETKTLLIHTGPRTSWWAPRS
jgi:acyl-CoA reductase-like NAD-dependent aldehyde dehydrogenase